MRTKFDKFTRTFACHNSGVIDKRFKLFRSSTSSQITKPSTSNNNSVQIKNLYKMKKNNNLTTSSSSTKSLKTFLNADLDLPTSTINSNMKIPYRFRKSTSMFVGTLSLVRSLDP